MQIANPRRSPARAHRRLRLAALVPVLALAAACGTSPSANRARDPAPPAGQSPTAQTAFQAPAPGPAASATSDATEVPAPAARLAIAHAQGIEVLGAATLTVVGRLPAEPGARLDSAGNGRDVIVRHSDAFEVADLGAWAAAHGDHSHYYAAPPRLTGQRFAAAAPEHVAIHDGRTALFDDATGLVRVFDSDRAEDPDRELRQPTTSTPHHGVAVELPDGVLVVSDGTVDQRTGIRVLDRDNDPLASSDQCPGIHGEAVTAGEAAVFGCADGALAYAGGKIAKAASPGDGGQISALAGAEASPIALGNYRPANLPEGEASHWLSLVDTGDATIRVLDIGAAFNSWGLARGEGGEAYVQGTDGKLHTIDVDAGAESAASQVIEPWEIPETWSDPRPRLILLEGMAYITEPATRTVSSVDPVTGRTWKSASLAFIPNEMAGASGQGTGAHHHDG
jgi:hypothetical protein